MTLNHSYLRELEHLVIDTLLPVYEKYEISRGSKNPFVDINPDLLRQIKAKKQVPALLRSPEKST